ncbi:MFS transporter [Simkania negevensis]|uniref:MFS transporter n=1 Tax=Simkania negevensis TaxID=83561 RepID=A0ABS3AR14_9BACT|nr:MFS transporter [Simkania negevensis]
MPLKIACLKQKIAPAFLLPCPVFEVRLNGGQQINQQRISIVGICAGVVVLAMIFSMVNTAIPSIGKSLPSTMLQLQWIINIFGIVTCSTLVTFGRLADIYGRKKIYLFGLSMCLIGLLGASIARSIYWVIAFQGFLGVGNAVILPVSQALLSHEYPANQRSKAIALWALVIGVALSAGPLLGGFLTEELSWRWIYLAPLPVVVFSMITVGLCTKESKNKEDCPELDIKGALLLIVSITAFVLAVLQGGVWAVTIIVVLYLISAATLVLLLFVEKNAKAPIIHEDLFTNRRFVLCSIANGCLVFFIWADFFLFPLFLQSQAGFSPLQAGLLLLCITIPVCVLSPIVGKLYNIVQLKYLIGAGFCLLVCSAAMQHFFYPDSSLIIFVLAALFLGLTWGFSWGPTTTAAISTLDRERAGIASGTFVTIAEIGGALGVTITVSVVRANDNFVYGFHNGAWVLTIVSVVGLASALLLKKTEPIERNLRKRSRHTF